MIGFAESIGKFHHDQREGCGKGRSMRRTDNFVLFILLSVIICAACANYVARWSPLRTPRANHDSPLPPEFVLGFYFASLCDLCGHSPSLEPIQRLGVAVQHFLPFVRRHTGKGAFDEPPRVGIGRGDMRIVGFPHDVVDADGMAQLDAGLLVPEVHVHLFTNQLARPALQTMTPQPAAFPLVIAG